ncbi:restriction endonuclease [Streptomyces albus]|uniref:restriction endonuclease n=1 Tax=Streptomyces albus TaxID=1888 RepID=UPI0033E6A6FC
MSQRARPGRGAAGERRFDLRTTALFFLLLAILLCVLGFLARAAVRLAEQRPLWAAALAVLAVGVALLFRSRWRRFSAARYARRTAEVLEEAAEEASDSLRAAPADEAEPASGTDDPGAGGAAPPAPHGHGDRSTAPLPPVADCAAELDPDGFEQAVAELCARDDCRTVEVVGGAGDLGADVTAVTPDGRRLVIQCKRYTEGNKVGSQDVQRFGGTCFTVHGAEVAVVVTTSDFTAPALAYAHECGIVCVNGQELEEWRRGTGPGPWERAEAATDPAAF